MQRNWRTVLEGGIGGRHDLSEIEAALLVESGNRGRGKNGHTHFGDLSK